MPPEVPNIVTNISFQLMYKNDNFIRFIGHQLRFESSDLLENTMDFSYIEDDSRSISVRFHGLQYGLRSMPLNMMIRLQWEEPYNGGTSIIDYMISRRLHFRLLPPVESGSSGDSRVSTNHYEKCLTNPRFEKYEVDSSGKIRDPFISRRSDNKTSDFTSQWRTFSSSGTVFSDVISVVNDNEWCRFRDMIRRRSLSCLHDRFTSVDQPLTWDVFIEYYVASRNEVGNSKRTACLETYGFRLGFVQHKMEDSMTMKNPVQNIASANRSITTRTTSENGLLSGEVKVKENDLISLPTIAQSTKRSFRSECLTAANDDNALLPKHFMAKSIACDHDSIDYDHQLVESALRVSSTFDDKTESTHDLTNYLNQLEAAVTPSLLKTPLVMSPKLKVVHKAPVIFPKLNRQKKRPLTTTPITSVHFDGDVDRVIQKNSVDAQSVVCQNVTNGQKSEKEYEDLDEWLLKLQDECPL
jgi:hypothetical protein